MVLLEMLLNAYPPPACFKKESRHSFARYEWRDQVVTFTKQPSLVTQLQYIH